MIKKNLIILIAVASILMLSITYASNITSIITEGNRKS